MARLTEEREKILVDQPIQPVNTKRATTPQNSATQVVKKPATKVVEKVATQVGTLRQCEAEIRRYWGSNIIKGRALRSIRDKELYKPGSHSFERYCCRVWKMSRAAADYLIGQC